MEMFFMNGKYSRSLCGEAFARLSFSKDPDLSGNCSNQSDVAECPAWSADGVYPEMAPAILNTGRYIATTRPPITVPRNTIIKGSIMAVRFSTA